MKWLIEKLIGIKGANPTGFGPSRVDSLPDALGRVLKQYMTEDFAQEDEAGEYDEAEKFANVSNSDICTSCGAAAIRRVEGCEKCVACGASKCG